MFSINQTINLCAENRVKIYEQALVPGNRDAHTWNVSVLDGTAAESLEGTTAMLYITRADGKTVAVTGERITISGNTVSAVLPEDAYAVEGAVLLEMEIYKGNGIITCAQLGAGVKKRRTDDIVLPGQGEIIDLNSLLKEIAQMREASASAREAAGVANQATGAANQAAGAANQAAGAANQAAGKLKGLSATAQSVPYTSAATASVSDNGTKYIIDLGIPRGTPGAVVSETEPDDPQIGVWIDPNGGADDVGTGGSGVTIDPTLTASDKAAPADAVGEIRADVDDVGKIAKQNQREIFGFGEGILSRIYRVTFNSVWNSRKNQVSESASLAEIRFYDANGEACTMEDIEADSRYSAAYSAENAIDGNLNTFWSSLDDANTLHTLTVTFASEVSPAQMGICLRSDYENGIIDEMTVEARDDDGTWVEVAHITDARDGWDGQTERRFALAYRIASIDEKYGKAVGMANEALARATLSGTRLVIGDAIAGRVMRCTCDSPVTVRSRNRVALGDISFTGQYKLVKFGETIPAGTYRFSARTESTDTDSASSLIAIGGRSVLIAHDGIRRSVKVTINSDCSQMYLYSSNNAANGTGDTAYWRDIMITDGTDEYPYEPGRETVVYENPAEVTLAEITNIVEADTDIALTYARRNEWLDAILSATKSAELNAQTLGYVTPEMFGAVGDGVTDDLSAMQAALASAQELGLPVMANRSYLLSGGITIGSGMDVKISSVICTASEAAVQIKGSNVRASIRSIKAAGIGVELLADGSGITYNEIDLGSVRAGEDCIVLRSVNKPIFSNRVQFRQLAAGGDGFCCIRTQYDGDGSFITENSFTGGLCTSADWAYLGGGSNNKFYDFHVEDSIKGGFCLKGGPCTIIGARYAESQRDGEYPYLKIMTLSELPNTDAGTVAAVRFIGADTLKINEIDVSEVATDVYQASNPDNKSKLASSGALGHIDCRICGYGVTGANGYTIYQHFAESALIWGNCLILQGVPRKRYKVTESLDLRTIGPDTPGLPTIFDIGCAGCEIRLHPTYCFMGLDKFEVVQTDEYTATIYDYYTGGVIFNGASLGAGEFEVQTYLGAEYTRAFIDGEGMAWCIRRLDGTGSTPVTPETPEQEAQLSVDESGSATITGATLTVDESGSATISGAALTVDSSGNATIA